VAVHVDVVVNVDLRGLPGRGLVAGRGQRAHRRAVQPLEENLAGALELGERAVGSATPAGRGSRAEAAA
jgi:hypothetical protein